MRDFVAYYRVSTVKQGATGLGMEAQRAAVAEFVRARGGRIVAEFTEVESGRRDDRPQLMAALAMCRRRPGAKRPPGRPRKIEGEDGATLVIAKLDRLARNVAFVSNLMESGADFVAVDFPEANRLTVHLLAAVAEHEREAISTRTREAMRVAKAQGRHIGARRPEIGLAAAHAVTAAQTAAARARARPEAEKMKAQGWGFAAIARELNARAIPSPHGRSWHPRTVRMMLAAA